MVISINWEPTTNALHKIHCELNDQHHAWPTPVVSDASISEDSRRLARARWSGRVRATYVSAGQTTSLLRQLLALGAPLDIISGASYAANETAHLLSATIHILAPLHSGDSLTIPDGFFPMSDAPPTWEGAFDLALETFVFNFSVSQPIYEAISAITSDPAISDLSQAIADSLEELCSFGRLLIEWMHTSRSTGVTSNNRSQLPGLLAGYESLCCGTPELLDALAGKEITIETRTGNLGTLQPEQLAAIFYHALDGSIFPVLDSLGWKGFTAWQKHYRYAERSPTPAATIAAVELQAQRP